MEDYQAIAEQAFREAKLADHMAYVTSRIVNDKKIIISIVEHLTKAFMLSMKAYLTRARMLRKVRSLPEEDSMLIQAFFDTCAEELKIDRTLFGIITKLNSAVNAYNKRGILLTRTEKYVFVSPDYELIDLNLKDVKEWLNASLKFVNTIREKLQ